MVKSLKITIFVQLMKEILESNIQMVDLLSQYKQIEKEINQAISEVIESTAFINGPQVKEFERNIANYLGVKHAIGCGNGTDALQIALMALDLNEGDEVITTPFTFIATAEVIALLKLQPVFVDVRQEDFLIDPDKIEAAITPKTKVIIPVHLFGQSGNLEAVQRIAKKHNLFLIEDNAQAIGGYAKVDGNMVRNGAVGDISCTSFFPSKNLGCYGDGGAIFTNNDELAAKIRMITNHGSKIKYYHEIVGVNSRLDSIQAAILNVKLKYLDQYCEKRLSAALYYNDQLEDERLIKTPLISDYSTHVFHQYTLVLDQSIDRDMLIEKMKEDGVPMMVYYPVPLHLQKAFEQKVKLENSEALSKRVVSLPIHTELSIDQQNYIVDSLFKNIVLCIK